MSPSPPPGRTYRPALDGVRALAIVAVLLYHAGFSVARGGFLGVDLFFVLSGYLITGLLLEEYRTTRRLSIAGFYRRRARRLLPEAYAVVLATVVASAALIPPDRLGTIRADAVSTILYVANWWFIASDQSYFDQFGAPSPFRHMWSLAIEEQFYILFPLLLLVLVRVLQVRTRVAIALGGLAVASALWMHHLANPDDVSRVYYGADTRAFELLGGAVLALILPLGRDWVSGRERADGRVAWLGWGALVAVVGFCTSARETGSLLFNGGFVAFTLVSMVLLACIELMPTRGVARWLSHPAAVRVGQLSYGLYLWHWPVFVFVTPDRVDLPVEVVTLLRFALTAGLAVLSFAVLGQPFRHGWLRTLPWSLGRVTAVVAVPLMVVASITLTRGAVSAVDATGNVAQRPLASTFRVMVVGDSVGTTLGLRGKPHTSPRTQIQVNTVMGCALSGQELALNGRSVGAKGSKQCPTLYADWTARAGSFRPAAVVWTLGPWEVVDHVVSGQVVPATSPIYRAWLRQRLDAGLAALPAGVPVAILDVPCYAQAEPAPGTAGYATARRDPARVASVNRVLEELAADHPGRVRILAYSSLVCPGGKPADTVQGVKVRDDGIHLTPEGADLLWRWLIPQLGSDAHPAPRVVR